MQKTMDRFLNPCGLILFIVMLGLSLPILFASEEISTEESGFVLDEENIQDLETLSNKIHFKPHHHRHHHHCSSSCPTTTCCQIEKEQARINSTRLVTVSSVGGTPLNINFNFALSNVQGLALAIVIDPIGNIIGSSLLNPNPSGSAAAIISISSPLINEPYLAGIIALSSITPVSLTANSLALVSVNEGDTTLTTAFKNITSTSTTIGEVIPYPYLNITFTAP